MLQRSIWCAPSIFRWDGGHGGSTFAERRNIRNLQSNSAHYRQVVVVPAIIIVAGFSFRLRAPGPPSDDYDFSECEQFTLISLAVCCPASEGT
ncbi:hypothetical protein RRG08_034598 [Elysia crispata]|uniref:Uncharacterized protein n=1 Tax=Elysia crispata TaxID=231223 RepID=A0AAE1B1U1_9GAST|nr:hypothetical protein RRG08_034598 [Elysia crispata]